MKKVILFVIDALGSEILTPAIDNKLLPNFKQIIEHGAFREECISVFPSITPACLSSIITGEYPVKTEVPGNYWYDTHTDTVNYIGGDFSTILREGVESFLQKFLINLNSRFLSADTLFEKLERKNLKTASLNYFVYHGDHSHEISLPEPFNFLPLSASEHLVKGPSMLQLGDIHKPDIDNFDFSNLEGHDNYYGFEDDTTMAVLTHLVENDEMCDFTVAYLPDNDSDSHKVGPGNAVFTLQHADELLGDLFAVKGGIEQFLEEYTIFIVGDHSQSPLIKDKDRRGINVDKLLEEFNVVDAGTQWDEDEEMVVCPNLRATLLYFNVVNRNRFERVSHRFLADDRVDQIIWKGQLLDADEEGYFVRTATDGLLHFWQDDEEPMAHDLQGNGWSWDGNLATVDGHVVNENIIFPTYPNVFERLKNVLDLERSGDMWVTAKPGFTFHLDGMDYEVGGSHGALHRLDSTTSLLIAGHDDDLNIPDYPRIVDVAPMIMQCFEE